MENRPVDFYRYSALVALFAARAGDCSAAFFAAHRWRILSAAAFRCADGAPVKGRMHRVTDRAESPAESVSADQRP